MGPSFREPVTRRLSSRPFSNSQLASELRLVSSAVAGESGLSRADLFGFGHFNLGHESLSGSAKVTTDLTKPSHHPLLFLLGATCFFYSDGPEDRTAADAATCKLLCTVTQSEKVEAFHVSGYFIVFINRTVILVNE